MSSLHRKNGDGITLKDLSISFCRYSRYNILKEGIRALQAEAPLAVKREFFLLPKKKREAGR